MANNKPKGGLAIELMDGGGIERRDTPENIESTFLLI
jgi:hypothetical protein